MIMLRLLPLLCLLTLLAAPVQAAERQFAPAEPWSVYPYGPDKKACVVRAEMDNGFILALSGPMDRGPGRLSVDFRQPVFTVGQSYGARIAAPPTAPPAGALGQGMSPSVVALPVGAGAVSALTGAQAMALEVEGNRFTFALPGLAEAMRGFAACSAPTSAPVASVPEAPKAAPKPVPEPKPEPIVVDLTDVPQAAPAPVPQPRTNTAQVTALQRDLEVLTSRAMLLEKELVAARSELNAQREGLASGDWDLEEATIRFQESERQVRRLGDQVARERLACQREKADLEAMLFDPAVTEQRQLAKLADMERKLAETQDKARRERARYEARIAELERNLARTP